MVEQKKVVLVINPGSTSVKLAVYRDNECVVNENRAMKMSEIVDNLETYDMNWDCEPVVLARDFLKDNNIDLVTIDIVVGRAGPTPPIKGGAFVINKLVLNTLRYAPVLKHPSSLVHS
jgi:butyrate kinase